jgi:hypothetical protein
VTRESEWDDYTRSRVMALIAYEALVCPDCGNFKTLVELPDAERKTTWDEHDGRRFVVTQYRCLACASVDAVKRAWLEKHADDGKKPRPPDQGDGLPIDGLKFAGRPVIEEEV